MLKLSPLLIKIIAGLVITGALGAGYYAATNHYVKKGRAEVQALWDADKAKIKAAEDKAVAKRNKENEDLRKQFSDNNEVLGNKYNEELSKVKSDLAVSRRLRVGTAICGRPSSPANPQSAPGSIEANTGGGLVREDIERDIRALELRVEEGFAAGRACQGFVRANDLM